MRMASAVAALAALAVAAPDAQLARGLDRDARRWVDSTLEALSLPELAGQMVFARMASTYLASDSAELDELSRLVRDGHIGGVVAFGGEEPVPRVRLNPTYGSTILGQPLALASLLNRLQVLARVPLLVTADFEWGVGMRIAGATKLPRAMAFGASGDAALAERAAHLTAVEGRALGVHVNFAPVADVNNNPRNPVINIRSFGEDPARVGALVAAWTRGLDRGGMLATLKHFPGHGDTDVDSHLGLPVIDQPRQRLEALELPPFRSGLSAGAPGVMVAHIELPAVDEARNPSTFSKPVVTGLLRNDLGFEGTIYSDALRMDAIARLVPPGEAAVRAVEAGIDVLLDSPDPMAAAGALVAAVESGRLTRNRLEASVRRLLEAKARVGVHKTRTVSLDAVPGLVGGRAHEAVAREAAERAVTLIKDDRSQVPLTTPRTGSVLYLSVLDYPSNWRTAAPSRTFIPELEARWPDVQAIELSDRTTPNELSLVEAMASRFDAIIVGVFVGAASGSGRLDLAPQVVRTLERLAERAAGRGQPMVAAFFGSPYAAIGLRELPAMLLTYDFSDHAERAAVRALAGEIPVTGRLPVSLPEFLPLGHGLVRQLASSGRP